jgi:hypothetical protein
MHLTEAPAVRLAPLAQADGDGGHEGTEEDQGADGAAHCGRPPGQGGGDGQFADRQDGGDGRDQRSGEAEGPDGLARAVAVDQFGDPGDREDRGDDQAGGQGQVGNRRNVNAFKAFSQRRPRPR